MLTHCNAGALATAGYGTALGSRALGPRAGQGTLHLGGRDASGHAGLAAHGLGVRRDGIPHRLIADVAAASADGAGQVDLVVTGADRIAANGDTANKIGTYALAVLARHHRMPFYIAAPFSTIDPATADRRGDSHRASGPE